MQTFLIFTKEGVLSELTVFCLSLQSHTILSTFGEASIECVLLHEIRLVLGLLPNVGNITLSLFCLLDVLNLVLKHLMVLGRRLLLKIYDAHVFHLILEVIEALEGGFWLLLLHLRG